MNVRGETREANLTRDVYFADQYFALPQLCSFAHQIHDIHHLKPRSILEVGIGNGFVSTFLKRAGYSVTTADINEALEPDICSPISSLPEKLGGQNFDLVVCCEVLEHLPFDQFDECVAIFNSVAPKLYLTLPNYKRVFGIGGFLRLPKKGASNSDLHIELPNSKILDKEHFWEVGHSKATSIEALEGRLKQFYSEVAVHRYVLNPYHIAFTAR